MGDIPRLERLSYKVHYDSPRAILPSPFILDPVYGRFSISPYLLASSPKDMAGKDIKDFLPSIFSRPSRVASRFGVKLPSFATPTVKITPTSVTRGMLDLPDDVTLRNTKVCVIDTGFTPLHPQVNPLHQQPVILSVTPEPPVDALGHGQWCATCAFCGSAKTPYGEVRGVALASGRNLLCIKALSNAGFGLQSSILQAMNIAHKFGARVVSMSLGGPLSSIIEEDPECQIIEKLKDEVIFVVAAGNSGPGGWTIESPGASPYAVTVGAWSTFYNGIAIFSSKGPTSPFYQKDTKLYSSAFSKYKENLLKPDVVAPGGGPVLSTQIPDMIYSGCTGWINGQYDNDMFDAFEPLRGTSMATPHAAGVIALAIEHGLVNTAQDVKARMKGVKQSDVGYGFLTYKKLLTPTH